LVKVSHELLTHSSHVFAPDQAANFSLIDAQAFRSPLNHPPFGLKAWVSLKQVHGAAGVHQDILDLKHQVEADWHYTYDRGLGLAIFVADCTAILLRGKNQRGDFVAAIHAGWRGTAAGIIEEALEKLLPSDSLYAWLSPSICQKDYEVDESVVQQFSSGILPFIRESRPRHYFLDLKSYQIELLKKFKAKVWSSSLCTFCQPEFFSYRRSKAKLENRHFAWIALSD
jgi:YfiH family protein